LSALVSRPIAHRGLHDLKKGIVENSIAASLAAVAAGYAIECDVQLSRDGEAIVFHDDDLDRLTVSTGPVARLTAAELTQLRLLDSGATIPTFPSLLSAVGGRALLVIELKSRFDGDPTLARRVAEVAAAYGGPLAIESFDPDPIAFLRKEGPGLGVGRIPLGIVAQRDYGENEWPQLDANQRLELTHFLHYGRTRPEFLSFHIADYPHATPALFRQALHLPVIAWTARSRREAEAASAWADAVVFEDYLA